MQIRTFITIIGALFTITAIAKDKTISGGPVFELQNSHISRGYGTSIGGAFSVISSIAETAIGKSTGGAFTLYSGLLKPSEAVDLIFINGFE